MKVSELIKGIDSFQKNKYNPELTELFHAIFDMNGCDPYFVIQDENDQRMCYYEVETWICTDTQVGMFLWVLDDEPVCIDYRPYRKSFKQFLWLSKEAFDKTKKYMEKFIPPIKNQNITIINDTRLTEIMDKIKKVKNGNY